MAVSLRSVERAKVQRHARPTAGPSPGHWCLLRVPSPLPRVLKRQILEKLSNATPKTSCNHTGDEPGISSGNCPQLIWCVSPWRPLPELCCRSSRNTPRRSSTLRRPHKHSRVPSRHAAGTLWTHCLFLQIRFGHLKILQGAAISFWLLKYGKKAAKIHPNEQKINFYHRPEALCGHFFPDRACIRL